MLVSIMMTETTYRQMVEEGVYDDIHTVLDPICRAFVSQKHNAIYNESGIISMNDQFSDLY